MIVPMTLRRLAALLVGTLLFLTACSGDDSDASGDDAGQFEAVGNSISDGGGDTDSGAPADVATDGESAAGTGGGPATPDLAPSTDPALAGDGRDIISTAEIHLRVDDLAQGVRRVDRLVAAAGGFVFGENTDLRTGARTRIVLKVPPRQFRGLLADLGELGDVETQNISTEDVTDRVVDLESRISTAEISVLRLRALLAEATAIPDIANIENQLLNRETSLEELRGQLRTIENQVSLATITAVLRSERTSPPPPPPPPAEPQTGFRDGLHSGARALRTFAVGASAVAGALLPWSPLLLVAAFVGWQVARRRRSTVG
jgi:Domain of unknown function (DUF4349)